MKDFYQILGLKEDASEEEIRERWLELTKQYHPDRSEESTSAERIREINEAYQVLKHSSTRVEYDLKRTYGRGEEESRRGSCLKKLGLPAGILIVLMMIGILYFLNSRHETNGTDPKGLKNSMTQLPNDLTANRPGNAVGQTPLAASTLVAPTHQPIAASTHPRGASSTQPALPHHDTMDAKTQQRIDVPVQRPKVAAAPPVPIVLDRRDQTDKRNRIGSSTQTSKDVMSPITPSVAMAAPREKVELPQPLQTPIAPRPNDVAANRPIPSINQIDQRNQIIQRNSNIEPAQFKPTPLVSTEDEVEKFVNHYVNSYNRRDAKEILSLFSSKAVQNQKDGLEEIRKIYADFFREGQGIRYSLQDMKIEIYQNAVVVKARYEIEQVAKTTGEKEVWRGPIRWVLIKEDGKLKILAMDYKYHRPLFGKGERVE